MELSTQAKSLYKEFPNLSESDIRSIDNKIKKKRGAKKTKKLH